MTKSTEVHQFIQRCTENAIRKRAFDMDQQDRDTMKRQIGNILYAVAAEVSEQYRIMELADIFEWKRTRIKGR